MTRDRSVTTAVAWTPLVARVLAPNPGPMTLDGTNSIVLRAPGHGPGIVVDPGPDDPAHLRRLAELGPIDLILLTHHHLDHSASSSAFAELTGAPVRAIDANLSVGAPPLVGGDVITVGGCRIDVIATPGHTADSASFLVTSASESYAPPAMLTGDTILGEGTTIISRSGGSLRDYLRSLEQLREFGDLTVIPGHGPVLASLREVCDSYLEHRLRRLSEIRGALDRIGTAPSAEQSVVDRVVDAVYSNIDPGLRAAATAATLAQLVYLAEEEPA